MDLTISLVDKKTIKWIKIKEFLLFQMAQIASKKIYFYSSVHFDCRCAFFYANLDQPKKSSHQRSRTPPTNLEGPKVPRLPLFFHKLQGCASQFIRLQRKLGSAPKYLASLFVEKSLQAAFFMPQPIKTTSLSQALSVSIFFPQRGFSYWCSNLQSSRYTWP